MYVSYIRQLTSLARYKAARSACLTRRCSVASFSTAIAKKYQIVALDGDGVGPELMASTKEIISAALDSSDISIEWINIPFGYKLYLDKGYAMNRDHILAFEEYKMLLTGPVTCPPGSDSYYVSNLETGTSYADTKQAFRQIFDLYAHVRPAISYKNSPFKNVDIVIIRENTEDLYCGEEHIKNNGDTVEAIKRITKHGSDRIAKFAMQYAQNNKRKLVTAVHKSNVCKQSDGLFLDCHRNVFADSESQYGIKYNEQLADSMLYKLMINHKEFDVVSCPNLFGDLISDLLGGMIGSLGLMPSAQLNEETGYAMFEPIHGSAPDIGGQNIANPISQWRSAVLMLEYMGYYNIAQNIENGIQYLLENDLVTPELYNGKCTTTEMTNHLCKYLKSNTL